MIEFITRISAQIVLTTLLVFCPSFIFSQCGTCESPSGELVVNGNFSQGDSGFYSDYDGDPDPGPGLPPLWNAGSYQVGNDANDFHWDFDGYALLPFPFFGNFMVVNGSEVPGANIWCQDIAVVPGGSYTFTMNVQSVVTQNPAQLQVQINGVDVGDVFDAPANLNNWQEHTADWIAPPGVFIASVCITNVNTTNGGNDFGLDGISFQGCEPQLLQHPANAGADLTVCAGETVMLGEASYPGYNYTWLPVDGLNNGSIGNPELAAANNSDQEITIEYILVADSANLGCLSSDTVLVTVLPSPEIGLLPDTAACELPITLAGNANNVNSWLWNTGEDTPTIEVDVAGDYTLTVSNGICEATATTSVSIAEFDEVDLGPDITVCTLPVLLETGIADGEFLWSTGETTPTISAENTGVYSVTVSQNGCSSTDEIEVFTDSELIFDLGEDTGVCEFPFEISAPLNNADYLWNTGATTQNLVVDAPGTYSVNINQDGCTGSDEITISQIDFENVDLGDDQTVCLFPVTLEAGIAGESYLWSNEEATPFIVVDEPGTYSVTVVQNGCESISAVTVNQADDLPLNLGNDLEVCQFPVTIESPVDNVNYTWSDGSDGPSIEINEPGTVWLEIEQDGCTGSDEITVSQFIPDDANLPDTSEACIPPVVLTAEVENADFSWSNGQQTPVASFNSTGWAYLTWTQNGCPATDSTYVIIENTFEFNLIEDTAVCAFPFIFESGVNAENYLWSTGSQSASTSIPSPGIYTLSASVDGCEGTRTVDISQIEFEMAELPETVVTCSFPVIIAPTASQADFYAWSNGSNSSTATVNDEGEISVTVTDNGCASFAETEVILQPLPEINLSETTLTICEGDRVFVSPEILFADSIAWNHGTDIESIWIEEAGNYVLVAQNICGTSELQVELLTEDCSHYLFIPNAFSPNEDGINDLLEISAVNFIETEIQIFSRDGQIVYQTTDVLNNKWNGAVSGSAFYSQPTLFVYQFEGKTIRGQVVRQNGTITVVR